jgi:hypothetical protein
MCSAERAGAIVRNVDVRAATVRERSTAHTASFAPRATAEQLPLSGGFRIAANRLTNCVARALDPERSRRQTAIALLNRNGSAVAPDAMICWKETHDR